MRPLRPAATFLALLASSRLALLVLIGSLVGGREFADDARRIHLPLARDPLQLLSGEGGRHAAHPPLLGLLEALFVRPLEPFFSDFYTIRLAFLAWELLLAAAFWHLVRALELPDRDRRFALTGFLCLPMGWMTSVGMAQDEVIAATLLALSMLLAVKDRPFAALAVCGAGVVGGKVFLLVPLLALIVCLSAGRGWQRAAVGLAPVLLVYLGVVGLALANGRGGAWLGALEGFTPPVPFGTNLWVLVMREGAWTPALARRGSSILALVGAMIPWVWYRIRAGKGMPVPFTPRSLLRLTAAMLLWVFVLFYHVNPEYYLLLLPLLLPMVRGGLERVLAVAVFSVPWAVNFLYGVRVAMEGRAGEGGKQAFVRLYRAVVPVDPGGLELVALLVCSLATILLAVRFSRPAAEAPLSPR